MRLKLAIKSAGLPLSVWAMNQKNLNYEIETV